MEGLSGFLAQNAAKPENVKHVVSTRFKGKNGDPLQWEIACITSADDEAIRKQCTKRVQVPGKRNQYTEETDYNRYLGVLAARCTVFPNLNDAELQNSYGVMGDDTLLKAMLLPGEYADYLTKVQEVNGYDKSAEDLVEEAKN